MARRPHDESRCCDACGDLYFHQRGRVSKYCSVACKADAQRTLPDAVPRACPTCGDVFTPPRKYSAQRFCGHSCAFAVHGHVTRAAAQAHEAIAKRADALRGTGKPGNYIKRGGRHEHRVVAEQKIGRALQPGEIVHHDDENKSNNHPDNLIVLPSQAEHFRLHHASRRRAKL